MKAHFGQCHRVLCRMQALLPVGLSDNPHTSPVKLYCPRCEDIYVPKSSRHASIDGAYFGTSFPHIFLQCYTNLIPPKTEERVLISPRRHLIDCSVRSKAFWVEDTRVCGDPPMAR